MEQEQFNEMFSLNNSNVRIKEADPTNIGTNNMGITNGTSNGYSDPKLEQHKTQNVKSVVSTPTPATNQGSGNSVNHLYKINKQKQKQD